MIGVIVLFPKLIVLQANCTIDTWGFADVEAAAAAILDWIESVGWRGSSVDVDRWLVSGHSNGGTYHVIQGRKGAESM